jgi:hypothetical protein
MMIMVVIGDCGYVTLASMVGAGLTTILPSFFEALLMKPHF